MSKENIKSDLTLSDIGNRISSRRKELNFTLQEIADMVGVASSTIQRYEKGLITKLKLPVIESIAKALNVNPVWLVKKDAKKETGIIDSEFLNKINSEKTKNTLTLTFKNTEEFLYGKKDKDYVIKRNSLIEYFDKLNSTGQDEALKRVSELTEINRYLNTTDEITATTEDEFTIAKKKALEARRKAEQYFKENPHLMPVASHDKEGNFTDEDYKHDDDIMNNDDLWND